MPTMSENCLFCRIASGDIPARKVYEDPEVVAFEDVNPQAPTHVLVIPRQHIPSLDAMTELDHNIVGRTMFHVSEIARQLELNEEGYRVVLNTGAAAGQTVFHIHFHLLGGRAFRWPPG